MYNYGLFVLYSRNQHNIKAIFLQLKNKLKKKEVLPWWLSGEESTCQCRRHEFDPWSGKIPCALGQLSPCITTVEPVL